MMRQAMPYLQTTEEDCRAIGEDCKELGREDDGNGDDGGQVGRPRRQVHDAGGEYSEIDGGAD